MPLLLALTIAVSAALRHVSVAACPIVLDVRTQGEWDAGHISCAHLVPVQNDPARYRPAVEELTQGNKAVTIVTYCAAGVRAGSAERAIESWGYTDVVNGGGFTLANMGVLEAYCSCTPEPTDVQSPNSQAPSAVPTSAALPSQPPTVSSSESSSRDPSGSPTPAPTNSAVQEGFERFDGSGGSGGSGGGAFGESASNRQSSAGDKDAPASLTTRASCSLVNAMIALLCFRCTVV